MQQRSVLALVSSVLAASLIVAVVALRRAGVEAPLVASDARDAEHEAHSVAEIESFAREGESAIASAGDVRAGTASPVRGRVIDEANGAGLAGFAARWNHADGASGEVVSNHDGTFFVPAPADASSPVRATVQMQAAWGWVLAVRELELVRRADGAFEELVFMARASRFAPLRLRLVDAATNEELPDYMLRIGTRDGQREQVTTDERGELVSSRDYAEGPLQLFCHDVESSWQSSGAESFSFRKVVEHDAAREEPLTVQLAVGPTYRFDLLAPVELPADRLAAWISHKDVPRMLRFSRSSVPVREGDAHWVRFRQQVTSPDAKPEDYFLCVASLDGRWFGQSAIESLIGIHPGRVAITLEQRASLRGVVRETTGEPIGGAVLELGSRSGVALLRESRASGNGLFEIEMLAAGRYVLEVGTNDHEIARVELDLAGGEQRELEITLSRARSIGAIAGRLISAAEPHGLQAKVTVLALASNTRLYQTTVVFVRVGERWEGNFSFENVPAGDYSVSAYLGGRWTPTSMSVSAPATGLEFVAADETGCITFEATDAERGTPIEPLHVVVLAPGCSQYVEMLTPDFDCIEHLGALADDARWIASARGFAPCWGTRADLAASADGFLARPKLARGWGVELEALAPGVVPLSGVEVLLDGELAGTTDERGIARIVRTSSPNRIDVRHASLSASPSCAAELEGARRGAVPRVVIYFARR